MLLPVKKYIHCCPVTSKSTKIFKKKKNWTVFTYKRCLICADFSPDSDKMTFSLEEAILWTINLYFKQKQRFNDGFIYYKHSCSLHKTWINGLDWCGLLVMFLSAVWILIMTAPIRCRGSTGEHLGWPDFQQMFIFGWTIPLIIYLRYGSFKCLYKALYFTCKTALWPWHL